MAGTLTATTIQNDTSSPPTFRNNSVEIGTLCRAWVNFNGVPTVSIRASFNVSSITRNGTGDYTVNFTNALPDANYSAQQCASDGSVGAGRLAFGYWAAQTTTAYRIIATTFAGGSYDAPIVAVVIFR
jgi:hypothetical protein